MKLFADCCDVKRSDCELVEKMEMSGGKTGMLGSVSDVSVPESARIGIRIGK